jgi:hypothetical protein
MECGSLAAAFEVAAKTPTDRLGAVSNPQKREQAPALQKEKDG